MINVGPSMVPPMNSGKMSSIGRTNRPQNRRRQFISGPPNQPQLNQPVMTTNQSPVGTTVNTGPSTSVTSRMTSLPNIAPKAPVELPPNIASSAPKLNSISSGQSLPGSNSPDTIIGPSDPTKFINAPGVVGPGATALESGPVNTGPTNQLIAKKLSPLELAANQNEIQPGFSYAPGSGGREGFLKRGGLPYK